jgi:hypothetical protein
MADLRHEIPELDRAGLRQFGLVTGGIVASLFGLLLPWLFERPWPLWPWVVFAILAVWALAGPSSLRPVYRAWMRFGLLLSRVTTPVILGIVYFMVIAPAGFLMRVAGKDPMRRRLDENTLSYRVQSRKGKHMEKPF